MTPAKLAQLLVDTHSDFREICLHDHKTSEPIEIAEALQQMCYEAWTEDPQRVSTITDTLHFLADITGDKEISGYAVWAEAIRNIVDGELAASIEHIDLSESTFSGIGKPHLAAKTQTSKIYCLALLGRYDEAIDAGEKALKIFLEHGDLYSAGKTEHNIGNLYWRRDMYREAEPYLESARLRFVEIGDQRQIAMVENCQAFVKTLQNQFRKAETLYKRALERAEANDLTVTEAEIETGLSNLYLFESKYDLALKFMERSRQKYERLEMPNQSAMCELEMADIYLELNLLPEAVEFYRKVAVRLGDLGLQAELARCSLSLARALTRLQEKNETMGLLDKAEHLYGLEGNAVAVASVRLARSQLLLDRGDVNKADEQVDLALEIFKDSDNFRFYLYARWLKAEILIASSRTADAVAALKATLAFTKEQSKEVEYLCLTSLGKVLENEQYLKDAIELVESSRESLSLDELRTSYFAEKITPYNELIKIKFKERRFEEAFYLHERSRARTLVEQLHQSESVLLTDDRLAQIREELNWYYSRINRSPLSGSEDRSQLETLRNSVLEKEKEYSELLRRNGIHDERTINGNTAIDIREFRRHLDKTTVVEFASIDGRISAFVISKDDFTALPNYADEAEINDEIKHFLFQIKTGRFIDLLSDESRSAALNRFHSHSRKIYDRLLRPLNLGKAERLVFARSGLMNYLPFHALHTGNGYLIESVEVSYAPSVSVLEHCLKRPSAKLDKALIVGHADMLTPMVEAEIESVAGFFDSSTRLAGTRATLENIRQNASGMGVVHFACHGKFRPDNPDFSSLALYEEELTVNEVRNLPFDNSIIILSSCETGLNEIVRGEELIGLTRAFFAAGACTLILSLWRVDDNATLDLMTAFYEGLIRGKAAAGALRSAQQQLIKKDLHPYLWSPFMVSGRW